MIERIIQKAMFLLALTAGCRESMQEQREREYAENLREIEQMGIPIIEVPYQKPDDVILQVWESLKTLNNGQPYEIKVEKDSPRELYHLCFDGDGFKYRTKVHYHGDKLTGATYQYGSFHGNPYVPQGAVLARDLRESPIRQTLLTVYKHRNEMIPYTCSL